MSGDETFDGLLDQLLPGATGPRPAADPGLPTELGLVPRGVLGAGASGTVYRAYDPVLEREVAVKVGRAVADEAARGALLDEARTTARIGHPAVLPVHRVAVAAGRVCVEFRLAPDSTLEHRLAELRDGTAWSMEERLHVMLRVSGAVARAHALGVVHGDLHPGNVALGASGEPYVLDWAGLAARPDAFSGTPGYAAPEQLAGEAPTAASDVFALGALLWELVAGAPLRPRRRGEALGAFLERWRDARAPSLATRGAWEPALVALVDAALATAPSSRPTAEAVNERLGDVLTGSTERLRREAEAMERVDRAHAALTRVRALGRQVAQEQQVLGVQRAKIPGWAPAPQKRSLWSAEARVAALEDRRARAWDEALSLAEGAATLADTGGRAQALLAELWWSALERAEHALDGPAASRAEEHLRAADLDGRFSRLLDAPALLSIEADAPGATVRLAPWRLEERVLRAEGGESLPLPLREHRLAAGSWLAVIEAPGRAPVRLPLRLGRAEERVERVPLYAPEQVGEGWVQVPAGAFIMGGDPAARAVLDRCEPWLDGFFIRRTCVTAAEWLEFLDALDPDEAARHVPGEMGFFGGSTAFWAREGGRWRLPPGWPPDLPAIGLCLADIERYCAWRSEREGRVVRLPTEEEWEKAARGVDGRFYPWGDRFDPTFAHMRRSRPGRPHPVPVGQYPVDRSPYGVLDMAGGVREWTGSVFDEGQMVIRGGTFGDDADDLRCAGRAGFQPEFRFSYVGFRVVAEGPRPAA